MNKRLLACVLSAVIAMSFMGCVGGRQASNKNSKESRPEQNVKRMMPANDYIIKKVNKVNGRQGVCVEDDKYYVSGSTTLTRYSKDWKLEEQNTKPFDGYKKEVNHIADIDIFNNEIYVGAEYFMDGVGKNIQIAIYDAKTLKLKKTFPFEPKSGQLECSGIAVDSENEIVWMCSWVGEGSGRYIYKYNLKDGKYLGKVHLQMPPQWLQGIACYNGELYMTADDGEADNNEPDHLYRTKLAKDDTAATVVLERTFDDVKRQGEIEGLTFDKKNRQMLLLYNRGARIILGMPKGFYPGYKEEISEVYTFDIKSNKR